MGLNSKIQWCDHTWNPVQGCYKVDEDCRYCYWYRDAERFKLDPRQIKRSSTRTFRQPYRIKEKSKIFVPSWSDLFLPEVDEFRENIWQVIRETNHIYQIPTKRPHRIIECLPEYWEEIRDRVWLGTSIGSMNSIHRLGELILPIQPGIRFLSLEPLHGPITLPLEDFVDFGHKVKDLIDWIIIGGESGNESGKYRYRECNLLWIFDLVDQCTHANIPVFVKQLGTHLAKKLNLSDRHGGNMDEWPKELDYIKKREFPQ